MRIISPVACITLLWWRAHGPARLGKRNSIFMDAEDLVKAAPGRALSAWTLCGMSLCATARLVRRASKPAGRLHAHQPGDFHPGRQRLLRVPGPALGEWRCAASAGHLPATGE